jgi:hypothetical protein
LLFLGTLLASLPLLTSAVNDLQFYWHYDVAGTFANIHTVLAVSDADVILAVVVVPAVPRTVGGIPSVLVFLCLLLAFLLFLASSMLKAFLLLLIHYSFHKNLVKSKKICFERGVKIFTGAATCI